MVSRPKQLVKVQIITKLLDVLSGQFSATNLQHFAIIIDSILGISNSVTTLSVAQYSSLSYRIVQRFYALKDVNWLLVNLFLFKHFIYQKGKSYLFAADETVKGKAGKQTHGLGRFYSSMAKQVIRSVSFLVISIIDTVRRWRLTPVRESSDSKVLNRSKSTLWDSLVDSGLTLIKRKRASSVQDKASESGSMCSIKLSK